MIVYIRCSKCHHQERHEGMSFGCPQCPKCGSNTIDLYTNGKGDKPDWWVEPEPVKTDVRWIDNYQENADDIQAVRDKG